MYRLSTKVYIYFGLMATIAALKKGQCELNLELFIYNFLIVMF